MNIKVEICDKAIELIDLLADMPLADDEFVDEVIDVFGTTSRTE